MRSHISAPSWREHLLALALYAALVIVFFWRVLYVFTTRIYGLGSDPLHNLWLIWHTREALLLQQPLFEAPFLYYPQGITLLTHGLGPVMGIFALPFWPLGTVAAHNGAVMVALWLTGYAMYLLARGMGFAPLVALFGGLALLTAPMALAGVDGHMTKVFMGGPPLALLALYRVCEPQRRLLPWAVGLGAAILVVLLHSGYQFVFTGFAVALMALLFLINAPSDQRRQVFIRLLVAAIVALVIIGPLLFAIFSASSGGIAVDRRADAEAFKPDLLNFIALNSYARIWEELGFELTRHIEKSVALGWTLLALTAVGLFARRKDTWPWAVLTLACFVMALGPSLDIGGETVFSPLPYAWLLDLPGMSFLRVPGRFMMVGFAGLAAAACFGLQALTQRRPHYAGAIVAVATLFLLVERWPLIPVTKSIPPTPDFYYEIADDPEMYGVLDLPFRAPDQPFGYVINSAPYQYFQTIHNKGIVAGYLSRTYSRHPFFTGLMNGQLDRGPADLAINGLPLSEGIATRERLAALGYRYVVWHKTIYPSGNLDAQMLIDELFPDQQPLIDDELVTVYSLESLSGLTASLGPGWWPAEANWRWGQSSSSIKLYARQASQITLNLTPAALYDPNVPGMLGSQGILQVQVGSNPPIEVPVTVEQPVSIPLTIPAGESEIILSLANGNFFPPGDERQLSFAVRSLNLQTTP